MIKQFKNNGGIYERTIESKTLQEYQSKAEKWDKAMALREERAKLKERLHQIGQEEAKLYGSKEKYREDRE